MKSYPSNFAFNPSRIHVGCRCECVNGALITVRSIGTDTFKADVYFMPMALVSLCRHARTNAVWGSDGIKQKTEYWPPRMDIKRIL